MPSGSKSGTPSGRWKRCRGLRERTNIGSTIGISSIGWYASRGPLSITGIGKSCFPAVRFGWPMTILKSQSRSAGSQPAVSEDIVFGSHGERVRCGRGITAIAWQWRADQCRSREKRNWVRIIREGSLIRYG